MAYRKRRTRVVRRRPTRKSYRRSTGRTRRYAKRARPMTRKAILSATSRKKRNTMLSVANTTIDGRSQTVAISPAYVIGTRDARFLWMPTAMDLNSGSTGGIGTIAQTAVRTASTCYMRGVSEQIRIQTSSGIPWFHRRICFTAKGIVPFIVRDTGDTSTPNPANPWSATNRGMQRLWLDQQLNTAPNTLRQRDAVIFKGEQGVDWNDPIVAPTDPTRITVRFDKTWTIRSGNERGTVIDRKLWHPMNKNLVYDDDESGDAQRSNFFSVDSKAGMGDYYIYDIIQPGTGAVASDVILLQSNATLYWHEK